MRKRLLCLLSVFIIQVLCIPPGELQSAPYYAGKIITIVVGSAPGGGYNNMARLLARHLVKYIPGNPSIIVQNMPGASGVIAANYVYNIAKPNGLTIGAIQGCGVLAQLVKDPGIKYDFLKFSWIGSADIETCVLTIRSDSPYKTIQDIIKAKQPVYFSHASIGGTDTQFLFLLMAFVSPNIKNVSYPSSSEAMLAIERKEVDGRPGSYGALKQYINRGMVRLLLRGRGLGSEELKAVPVDEDVTENPRGRTLMAIRAASDEITRAYVCPPGTPVDEMNILRDAFSKVQNDPALKEDAKKLMMQVRYVPAQECLKTIKFILNQPNDIVKEFSRYINF